MAKKRHCKTCQVSIDDYPPEEIRCETCQEKFEAWLDNSSPAIYYTPQRDGVYFDDGR